MEIKINVDKKNKERVLKLLGELVDAEAEGSGEMDAEQAVPIIIEEKSSPQSYSTTIDLLEPIAASNLPLGKPHIEKSVAGTWGMFNSFLPGKAALRILARMVEENNGPVSFEKFMRTCLKTFKAKDLSSYRGFPKGKESSASRTEWHLIRPFSDLGLIELTETNKGELVTITEDGLEFSKLPNPILDGKDEQVILSSEEQKWLINYLRTIDKVGYEEYSMLKEFHSFLKEGKHKYDDLLRWFSSNKRMLIYLKGWSRKKDNPKAFKDQVENVAAVFVTGKMALLRELGLVSAKRNDYTVIGEI